MAKIRVEPQEVPDGDKCYGCKHYSPTHEGLTCWIFKEKVWYSGNKLPQCIAATVKE